MKKGVMLINCARGGIVNEKDLYDAITSGKVAGAALDVFDNEPPGEHPLLTLDNVIATPHLGASTREAQTNVAVAVADQIIKFLKEGTLINTVNAPSVTGELLTRLGPFLNIADRLGCLLAQLVTGPFKEVGVEYAGDFHGLDLAPVTTALLKGLLTPSVAESVNSVNAPMLAKEMGIKVTETTSAESSDYLNLITVKAVTTEMSSSVAGTLFGRNDPRVVNIDDFRLEMVPEGYLALIHNLDKPGAIGSIGVVLGENDINIARMQVGQAKDGERNIIFLRTDTPMQDEVVKKLNDLPLIKSVIRLEL
jgi:D-3-phosphoglycerate dehydrogenase